MDGNDVGQISSYDLCKSEKSQKILLHYFVIQIIQQQISCITGMGGAGRVSKREFQESIHGFQEIKEYSE